MIDVDALLKMRMRAVKAVRGSERGRGRREEGRIGAIGKGKWED